jgi:hypothetical protein
MEQEWPAPFRLKATQFLEKRSLIYGLDFWWDDGLRVLGRGSAELVGLLLRELNRGTPLRWNEEKGAEVSRNSGAP